MLKTQTPPKARPRATTCTTKPAPKKATWKTLHPVAKVFVVLVLALMLGVVAAALLAVASGVVILVKLFTDLSTGNLLHLTGFWL